MQNSWPELVEVTLDSWRIFRRARCSPNWLPTAAKANLSRESYR
ncbi:hypothetical protein [Streptomyces sp. NPDC056682]